MDYSKIKCECNEIFNENEFENHYSLCPSFRHTYEKFDSDISELLKSNSKPKERLFVIHFLFNKYIEKIKEKIEKNFQSEFCQKCKNHRDVRYLPCQDPHPICYDCFLKSAEEDLYGMKYNICHEVIDEKTKIEILGETKYKELEKKYFPQNLIKCPNCGELIEFLEGKVENDIKLSPKASIHFAKNRCRCWFCQKDF